MSDQIKQPSHYADRYPFEVKDAIETLLDKFSAKLTPFEIYCLGNELKYRLRAGFKDDPAQDIGKALTYYDFRQGDNERIAAIQEAFDGNPNDEVPGLEK